MNLRVQSSLIVAAATVFAVATAAYFYVRADASCESKGKPEGKPKEEPESKEQESKR